MIIITSFFFVILGIVSLLAFILIWYCLGLCSARLIYKCSTKDKWFWTYLNEVAWIIGLWPLALVLFFLFVLPAQTIIRLNNKWAEKSEFDTSSERIVHFITCGDMTKRPEPEVIHVPDVDVVGENERSAYNTPVSGFTGETG